MDPSRDGGLRVGGDKIPYRDLLGIPLMTGAKDGSMNKRLAKQIKRCRQRTAATLTEYTFIVAIISIAGVVVLAAIGSSTKDNLENASQKLFPEE